jgi:hypothetical protein
MSKKVNIVESGKVKLTNADHQKVLRWQEANNSKFKKQWVALMIPECKVVASAPYLPMLHHKLDEIHIKNKKIVVIEC